MTGGEPRREHVAVVTGASRGLGRAIAEALCRQGWLTVLLARGEEALRKAREEIDPQGTRTLVIPCDVGVPAQVQRAFERILATWGRLDALINNAIPSPGDVASLGLVGDFHRDAGAATPVEVWDLFYRTNLRGALLCTQAAIPAMAEARGGHIVMIGSQAALRSEEANLPYTSMKWGLRGFSHCLGNELRSRNIAVTLVTSGGLDTLPFGGAKAPEGSVPGDFVPAAETADVVVDVLRRGSNTWIREIVVTALGDLGQGQADRRARTDPEALIDIHPAIAEVAPGMDEHSRFFWRLYDRFMAPSFYINVGPACVLDCEYCSRGTDKRFYFPKESLFRTVVDGATNRLGKGLFTGGEPSLHPDLDEVMLFGRLHGVERFGIFSNGAGLVDKGRVDLLSRLGMDFWHLSWPDFRPEAVDRVCGRKGHFDTLQRALGNLGNLSGGAVILFHVIHQGNLAVLPQAVDFFADLKDRSPGLTGLVGAIVKPTGNPGTDQNSLFSLRDARPILTEATGHAKRRGLPFFILHLQGCVLGEAASHSSFERLDQTFDPVRRELLPTHKAAGWTKGEACLRCRLFEVCTGYYRAYADRFGSDVFEPGEGLLRDRPLPSGTLETPGRVVREESPPVRESILPRLQVLLGRLLPEGHRLGTCSIQDQGAFREARFEVVGPDGTNACMLGIAPAVSGRSGFLSTPHLVLWYEGAELSPRQRELLQRIHGNVQEREGELLAVLTGGEGGHGRVEED